MCGGVKKPHVNTNLNHYHCEERSNPLGFSTGRRDCRATLAMTAPLTSPMPKPPPKIIQDYDSMESYWSDYELINQGKSPHTYWDTYENGSRRQLEQKLADIYGSESALFLNCGMSALHVALESQNLKAGDSILLGQKSYFETFTWLDQYLKPRGIELIRVDTSDFGQLSKALSQVQPKICLLETVINSPDCICLDFSSDLFEIAQKTLFIIDNTVQSHLTTWFDDIPKQYHNQLLIVESATKYITDEIMVGLIYGSQNGLSKPRDYARTIGQQLQQAAFSKIKPSNLTKLESKLNKHSRNVKLFLESLSPHKSYFNYIRVLNQNANSINQKQIFKNGVGSLVFLKLNANNLIETHRKLVKIWKDELQKQNIKIKICAGFGFDTTCLRSYEDNNLNQPDKPFYVRISIGIESSKKIKVMAKVLGEIASLLTDPETNSG